MRDLFLKYVDARIATHQDLPTSDLTNAYYTESVRLQGEIWKLSAAACELKRDAATTSLVMASLNTMIDITTTRKEMALMHPPLVVFGLLFVLALASAFVAGHGMASAPSAPWLHMLTFAAMISASVYLVLDLEYPRAGFVRIDGFDQTLANLRRSMH